MEDILKLSSIIALIVPSTKLSWKITVSPSTKSIWFFVINDILKLSGFPTVTAIAPLVWPISISPFIISWVVEVWLTMLENEIFGELTKYHVSLL